MTGVEVPVGRCSVFDVDGRLLYGSEADLRDGLAARAWLAGWDVETEVVVPSGGRIDLLLSTGGEPHCVIEVKQEIVTLRQARLGFQQVSSYRRFMQDCSPLDVSAILTGAAIDVDVARPVASVIDDVELVEVGMVLYWLTACPQGAEARLATALERRAGIKHLLTLSNEAIGELSQPGPSQ